MPSIFVGALMVALAAQASPQSAAGGRIIGTVVDSEGASIPHALVQVFRGESTTVASSTTTEIDGVFKTETLKAGPYALKIRMGGFRSGTVRSVIVQDSETTSAGIIRLNVESCDAPGVNCDYFFSPGQAVNFPPAPVSRNQVVVCLGCEVDLAKGTTVGPVPPHVESTDFTIADENGHLYMVAVNGAAISKPNSSDATCGNPRFGESRIQLDGLGLGDDFCVRTHDRLVSHVFPVEDIESTATEVKLWQVTRPR